ncbi:hypothetical protein [Planktothrix sp. FACHB-1365]|uniref:hypothetical protein n=1 Tax=Planktothrix sp. FACHB-1365 TaxID=2692855 RepID=UPI001683CA30|nr:hypothetical protein [Planktothrix sp. FACHB-1365]MBD2481446.1 hypothetical protein [Planktothrix sp. FACHB-1365]
MTQPPNESEVQRNKWSHLNQFERKYLKQVIQAYDQIMLEINDIDEVLLRHEVLESELVINQGINQLDAHQLAQAQYPWSVLINQR